MTAPLADLRPQAERVSEYFAGPVGQERYFALLHYTERLLRSMHWCISTDDDSMPGGAQPRDVVHDTAQSLLSGDPAVPGYRKLPAEVGVDVALKMIIWSKVNHAAEDAENARREDRFGVDREGHAVDHLETDAPMWEPSRANLSPQQQAHAAARCTRFIEFCRTDKVVYDMLIIIRDRGIDRPAERLAKELGIRPAEVYIARKRLGTLVRQFRKATTA